MFSRFRHLLPGLILHLIASTVLQCHTKLSNEDEDEDEDEDKDEDEDEDNDGDKDEDRHRDKGKSAYQPIH